MRDKLSDYVENKVKEITRCYTMENILNDIEDSLRCKDYYKTLKDYEYSFDLIYKPSLVFYDPQPILARAIKELSNKWEKETSKYYYRLTANVKDIDVSMCKTLDNNKCEILYKEEINDLSDNSDYYIEDNIIKRRVRVVDKIKCDDKSLFNSFFEEKEKLNAS